MSLIATHCRAIAARMARHHGRPPPGFCYTLPAAEWEALRDELAQARDRLGQPLRLDALGRFELLGTPVVRAPIPIRPEV